MNEFALPETQSTIDTLSLGNRGTLSAQPQTDLWESGVCTPDILMGRENIRANVEPHSSLGLESIFSI